jgi:hypothetical protein
MDLTKKRKPLKIIWYNARQYPQHLDQGHEKRRDRLLVELHKIGSRIAARGGPLKLRKSDLELVHETSWNILRNDRE